MNEYSANRQSRRAFTLIELLVVIAVMALLAAMIFPVTAVVNRNKIQKKARVELDQLDMFIQGYKDKLGFYPPGNPNNYAQTSLYYELSGTRKSAAGQPVFETLDRNSSITVADLNTLFGVEAVMNSMVADGGDEGTMAQRFLTGTRPPPTATLQPNPTDPTIAPKILVTSIGWKREETPLINTNPKISPVFYNPINPTNNPNSYDMWVDVIVGSKTNRISNWTKEPIVLQ